MPTFWLHTSIWSGLTQEVVCLWSLSTLQTQHQTKVLYQIKSDWSSGYKFSIILCNSRVLKEVEVFRPLLYIHVDNISTLVPFFTMILHTTTKILHFGQIWYPILDAFSVCIVQFIRVDANWSLQLCSVYLLGQYINSNLGHVICGPYTTTLLSHNQINECPIWAYSELVIMWCIGGIQSFSVQTSYIYPYGLYINSNYGYDICSKCTTTILVHERVQFPRRDRFFAFIVRFICAGERFSDSILSLYTCGRYINSNLWYVICSTHSNLILINTGYVACGGSLFLHLLCV